MVAYFAKAAFLVGLFLLLYLLLPEDKWRKLFVLYMCSYQDMIVFLDTSAIPSDKKCYIFPLRPHSFQTKGFGYNLEEEKPRVQGLLGKKWQTEDSLQKVIE